MGHNKVVARQWWQRWHWMVMAVGGGGGWRHLAAAMDNRVLDKSLNQKLPVVKEYGT
jgi:hypothetical protein